MLLMIKINLLQVKKRKPISIPIGWILVACYAIAACGGLYVVNNTFIADIEEKQGELQKKKEEVKRNKQFTEQLENKRKELATFQSHKNEYERILNSATGGWTKTLLLIEEVLLDAKTVWIRDLRIEADGRVQINGISKANKDKRLVYGIMDLLEAFKKQERDFRSPRVKRISWEPLLDQKVATFELQCVLQRN